MGINTSDDNAPVGRFSLALHVCMTPKHNNDDTSIAAGSDYGDYDDDDDYHRERCHREGEGESGRGIIA